MCWHGEKRWECILWAMMRHENGYGGIKGKVSGVEGKFGGWCGGGGNGRGSYGGCGNGGVEMVRGGREGGVVIQSGALEPPVYKMVEFRYSLYKV